MKSKVKISKTKVDLTDLKEKEIESENYINNTSDINEIVKESIKMESIESMKESIEKFAKENSNLVVKQNLDLDSKESSLESDLKNLNKDKLNDFVNLLKGNLESEILSSKTSEISDLSKDVKKYMNRQIGYLGFIFYVWNPKNLNIKIIPLLQINPILDLSNVKEFYFLYRPAMFIDGKPIFLLIRGIPLSFELNIIKDTNNMLSQIQLAGFTAQETRALLKSGFTTYLFGKPMLTLNQLLFLVFLFITCQLIQYIVLTSIFL